MPACVVATFYKFSPLPDPHGARAGLLALLHHESLKGTVLLAPEGVNGTLAGTREGVDAALQHLARTVGAFAHKESTCARQPFKRAKVRVKKEIIRFDYPLKPTQAVGTRVDAKAWNALLDSGIPVLDARNDYEVRAGRFPHALNPGTRSFTEIKDFVRTRLDARTHPRVATYCTGGVRCEKLSAWMLEQGFTEIFQLEGGILQYLEDMPRERSRWQGDCYVFDERVAVDEELKEVGRLSSVVGRKEND